MPYLGSLSEMFPIIPKTESFTSILGTLSQKSPCNLFREIPNFRWVESKVEICRRFRWKSQVPGCPPRVTQRWCPSDPVLFVQLPLLPVGRFHIRDRTVVGVSGSLGRTSSWDDHSDLCRDLAKETNIQLVEPLLIFICYRDGFVLEETYLYSSQSTPLESPPKQLCI